jgi:hypothetical protein
MCSRQGGAAVFSVPCKALQALQLTGPGQIDATGLWPTTQAVDAVPGHARPTLEQGTATGPLPG